LSSSYYVARPLSPCPVSCFFSTLPTSVPNHLPFSPPPCKPHFPPVGVATGQTPPLWFCLHCFCFLFGFLISRPTMYDPCLPSCGGAQLWLISSPFVRLGWCFVHWARQAFFASVDLFSPCFEQARGPFPCPCPVPLLPPRGPILPPLCCPQFALSCPFTNSRPPLWLSFLIAPGGEILGFVSNSWVALC